MLKLVILVIYFLQFFEKAKRKTELMPLKSSLCSNGLM